MAFLVKRKKWTRVGEREKKLCLHFVEALEGEGAVMGRRPGKGKGNG